MKKDLEKCKVYGELFSVDEMLHHKNIHTDLKPRISVISDLKLMTETQLRIHMRSNNHKEFSCETCGKECFRRNRLKKHMRSHSEDRPFECDICHRKFKPPYEINKHKKIHKGEKSHVCGVCGYATVHKAVLKTHQQRHFGEYLFKCDICNKGCFSSFEFKEHKKFSIDKKFIQGKSHIFVTFLGKHIYAKIT
jgi:hypothetical protein